MPIPARAHAQAAHVSRPGRPTLGVLAGWQFYRTATNLSYLAPLFHGISRAAHDLDCNLLLGCGIGPSASPADPLRPAWPVWIPEADFVPIGPWNTDGLIIASPLPIPALSAYAQQLIAQGHPVLFVGSGEPGPAIVADNQHGIFEAMAHLVGHGHRRIAFIAGTPEDMSGDSGERLRAYQAALDHHRLAYRPDWVAYGRHVYFGGYAAMQSLLAGEAAFTAVLVSNDESALGAMQALKEAGRRVPDDLALIGFDNRLEGAAHTPRLSSVHVPLFNIGYRSVVTMADHLRQGTELPRRLKVNTRLIARDSCGCAPLNSAPVGLVGLPLRSPQLAAALAERLLNQAHTLTEAQCLADCTELAAAFAEALETGRAAPFTHTLETILQNTIALEDEANIWQEPLALLGQQAAGGEILEAARVQVAKAMQMQYRRYRLAERNLTSHLSLLTARLLTALDEQQIYAVLAAHLPEMGIRQALVVLFEAEADNPGAWSVAQEVTQLERPARRFRSDQLDFRAVWAGAPAFALTLIPLTDPLGQLGFMVFEAEHLDLYGAIVQQVSGALNTARLYRQATEGRRLAEEANRLKSRFLSTISHELRTPINLILGLGGMLLQADRAGEAGFTDEARRDLERIQIYAQHLSGLIGDVIDLATSDAGQLRLNNSYVNLSEALRVVAESGHQMAADKGLKWSAGLPDSGPYVWGDVTRLRQVALNLVNNAIKFTAQGSVSLTLEQTPAAVTVTVRDTGLGIPPADQTLIFDEFRQSERSVAKGYGGLGVGLAICRKLVELHGGAMAVQSTGVEGEGAAVSFTLPVVTPPAEAALVNRLSGAGRKALLLAHRPETPALLAAPLAQRGFELLALPGTPDSEWMGKAGGPKPDVIILEVGAETPGGWPLLQALKSTPVLADVPVLFFSAAQATGALLELDYLTKPIGLADLTRALDQHWLRAGAAGEPRTILIVDDEPETLELHARIVRAHASLNRVLTAHSGQEALQLVRQHRLDLVLLDLQMPGMDGFEVLEALRRQETTASVPVIVVTGKVLTEMEMNRLSQSVAVVLGKGLFSMEETIAHISAALERKRRLSLEAQRLVRLAMVFIQANFARPLSRQEMARHVGITEDHLTFCFRQELGVTPIEYLTRYRINRARLLLKTTSQTVTEIALSVGFSDGGYFSRVFRREVGLTPEAFRRA